MTTDILDRLHRRYTELSATYGRGDKAVTGYTDDGKLFKEAYETIAADMRELGRLRRDNFRLLKMLEKYHTQTPCGASTS